MLCQRCKHNIATVNFVEVINGTKYESHLCQKCYVELTGDLDSNDGNVFWTDLYGEGSAEEAVACTVCGTRYCDYQRTGLVGCASCYDIFKELLLPTIRSIQGKDTHVGTAALNNDEYGLLRKLKSLQERLETAVKERRYTEANLLNKQIKDINKKLYGGDHRDD